MDQPLARGRAPVDMVSAPKYARIASERRFLLRELLADLDLGDLIRIVDSCWPGTRMRLRRMERRDGEIIQLKLIQKYFERGRSMMEMMITHPYLNQAEYALFHQLAGNQLFKRRSRYLHRGSG